ncbi:MAG: putative LPS assembly protein LptD [Bacteroidetes bacterium]|nr:putative LPS assembly protein LptD [Bacteroidota bacterium]
MAILFTITWKTSASGIQQPDFRKPLTNTRAAGDTIKPLLPNDRPVPGAVASRDTNKLTIPDTTAPRQKTDTFALKISKDSMDAPLRYAAEDSAVILVAGKKVILYGKTKTEYKDITLTAPKVEVDQQTQVVTAVNAKDSSGMVLETAHFKSGENDFTSDTIKYNFKSQIGLTKNTYTTTPDGTLIIGDVVKKVNANTTFVKGARFTTCLLDDPHFDIKSNKMKVVNQKLAVSGPAHLEFEGVPIPIYLPFGFYPLSQGRHSGLLRPNFVTDEVRGLGLSGLGYYKVLGPYWDAQISGDIYSYGEWAAGLRATYRKRYKFNGGLSVTLRSSKLNFKNDPDFSKTRVFNISWNHAMDGKARPGVNFSASVNAGSTKFNQLVPGNPFVNYQNILGSSITYSKSWRDKPFNFSLSATHSQNNNLRLINVTLPNATFTLNTIYPFQRKDGAGTPKWYEKLGVAYNGTFFNNISFYDSLGYGKNGVKSFIRHILDTSQWTSQHSIPITLSLPPILGGRILVAPGINYSQTWIQKVTNYTWNEALKRVDTTTSNGLYIDHTGSISLSFNTALFGTFQFKKSKKIEAIRHVVRPTIGFSYTPDLNRRHVKQVQVDTTKRKLSYNEVGGTVYYNAVNRKSASMTFGVDNNLEMKKRMKKDSSDAETPSNNKVKLIEGFGFNGSYNFIADSLNLSNINIYFRTTLFEKISINAQTTLNPYQRDKLGYDIAKYAWQGGKFSLGQLTTGSISLGTNFQSKPKDPKKDAERKKQAQQRLNDPSLIADQQRLLDYMQQNPGEFVDFNISWQLSLNYSLSFFNRPKPDYSGFENDFTSGVSFNGSFNLSPKWKLSSSGSYDFNTKKVQYITMSINRDMHCWQMSINVIPVGFTRSFNFTISPKATLLQDLKINRTRNFTTGY